VKAISLRQPWANAVLYLGKVVENRRWNTNFRGEFLIHAAKGMTEDEFHDAADFCEDVLGVARCYEIEAAFGRGEKPTHELLRGGIVGRARLVDVVPPREEFMLGGVAPHYPEPLREHAWHWHMREQFGFVLAHIRPVPFVECRGMPGFFDIDDRTAARAA
jgi:hypothetical protein